MCKFKIIKKVKSTNVCIHFNRMDMEDMYNRMKITESKTA
jgi:hypothetical protein